MLRKAKKSLGQNFLISRRYVEKIVSSVDPKVGDLILEIGPGKGALTKHFVKSGAKVIAVEIDTDMISFLQREFADEKNLVLIHSDVLKVRFADFLTEKAKLTGNLPYYISTAILQKIIRERDSIQEAVLMFQKEVADRLLAMPGDSNRGFLTVISEAFLEIEKLFEVPPSAFRPVPKVWSSVVKLKPKNVSLDTEKFFDLVGKCFSRKRKTIFNNLKSSNLFETAKIEKMLEENKIEKMRRAETLTLEEWKRLFSSFKEKSI